MKLVLILSILLPFQGLNQASLVEITRAINAGDADALGMYFDQRVEIGVQDKEDVYDKAGAIEVLRKFFTDNQPRSFSQVHKGASRGKDSQYCIGNLVTDKSNFRVYIYMQMTGDRYLVQELRFDKE